MGVPSFGIGEAVEKAVDAQRARQQAEHDDAIDQQLLEEIQLERAEVLQPVLADVIRACGIETAEALARNRIKPNQPVVARTEPAYRTVTAPAFGILARLKRQTREVREPAGTREIFDNPVWRLGSFTTFTWGWTESSTEGAWKTDHGMPESHRIQVKENYRKTNIGLTKIGEIVTYGHMKGTELRRGDPTSLVNLEFVPGPINGPIENALLVPLSQIVPENDVLDQPSVVGWTKHLTDLAIALTTGNVAFTPVDAANRPLF